MSRPANRRGASAIRLAVILLSLFRAQPLLAQGETTSEGSSRLRLRVGILTITPTIALANIGFDQNVFNEPTDLNPKTDFTFTVTPAVGVRMRLLRSTLTGTVSEDLVWYQTYASERTMNNAVNVRWVVPFNRLSLKINGRRARVRDRPGFEIDARSQRTETGADALVEVRLTPKTFVGVTAQRQRVDFDKAAVFLNSNLQFELNRVSTGGGLSLRYKLTPITSISLVATRTQDRFDFSPLRDSRSTVTSAVVSFDPLGILSGSATVGYTRFEPTTAGLPNFRGPTAAVDVSYRLLGTMRISVAAVRDIAYSYDVNQPYYVQTGVSGSVARVIAGPVDAVVRAGIQSLAYRDRAGAAVAVSNRTDDVRTYGGGIGYRLGKESRLGFNIDTATRISDVSRRQYHDVRFGSSVTYGF